MIPSGAAHNENDIGPDDQRGAISEAGKYWFKSYRISINGILYYLSIASTFEEKE